VSTGTVDRALNDKPGINANTRARVLAAADSLGYRPNLAARMLGTRRQLRVSVRLPETPAFFWQTVCDGLREAAAPFAPCLRLEFGADGHPGLADALITAPGPDGQIHDGAVSISYMADDVPDRALVSVSVDAFSIGSQAGELLGRFVSGVGQVAVVADSIAARAHAEQLRGFASSLSMFSPHLELAAVIESHDDERETHRRVNDMLRAHPRLKGLFVGARESLPILRAARQGGRLAGLAIVTTDISPEVFSWIQSGDVAAAINRRPLEQGQVALRLLYEYLQTRVLPTRRRQMIAPYAVTRSNLPIVLERLDIARAAARLDEAAHGSTRGRGPRRHVPLQGQVDPSGPPAMRGRTVRGSTGLSSGE
jgi:LacI family transcriptional regulator